MVVNVDNTRRTEDYNMCISCGDVHAQFVKVGASYEAFTAAPPHGPVLLFACGDEMDARLRTVRQLHAESFSGVHSASLTIPGGPLALIDPEGSDFLMGRIKFFIEHRNIECVHLCIHTDCGWASHCKYSWGMVETILVYRVIPMLRELRSMKGERLLIVPTIYAENGKLFNPRLQLRAA